ncbi:MAG TPA: Hpt domain-containing protein [Solirubrobacteraceae bacterium]|jgi:HPt (histidine-containing phosphotransfer) domain-containing protein
MGAFVQLDLERVAKLEQILGSGLREIIESLIASISRQLELAERALAEDRLSDVTQPAHTGRNDALLVGAQPLLRHLTELEDASRTGRLEDAREALSQVCEVWPETREALQLVVQDSPSGE